jgi:hypothetical protein
MSPPVAERVDMLHINVHDPRRWAPDPPDSRLYSPPISAPSTAAGSPLGATCASWGAKIFVQQVRASTARPPAARR